MLLCLQTFIFFSFLPWPPPPLVDFFHLTTLSGPFILMHLVPLLSHGVSTTSKHHHSSSSHQHLQLDRLLSSIFFLTCDHHHHSSTSSSWLPFLGLSCLSAAAMETGISPTRLKNKNRHQMMNTLKSYYYKSRKVFLWVSYAFWISCDLTSPSCNSKGSLCQLEVTLYNYSGQRFTPAW